MVRAFVRGRGGLLECIKDALFIHSRQVLAYLFAFPDPLLSLSDYQRWSPSSGFICCSSQPPSNYVVSILMTKGNSIGTVYRLACGPWFRVKRTGEKCCINKNKPAMLGVLRFLCACCRCLLSLSRYARDWKRKEEERSLRPRCQKNKTTPERPFKPRCFRLSTRGISSSHRVPKRIRKGIKRLWRTSWRVKKREEKEEEKKKPNSGSPFLNAPPKEGKNQN